MHLNSAKVMQPVGWLRQLAPFEDTQKGTTNPFLIFLVSAFDSLKLRVLGKSMKTFGDL